MKTHLTQQQLSFVEWISDNQLSERLRAGQCRGAAFLACAELAGDLACVPSEPKGAVFVWQNFGGCLTNDHVLDELIRHKDVSDVVVLGHAPCDMVAIDAANSPRRAAEEHVLDQLARVVHILEETKDPAGSIRVHGWLWQDDVLFCFDPKRASFMPARQA